MSVKDKKNGQLGDVSDRKVGLYLFLRRAVIYLCRGVAAARSHGLNEMGLLRPSVAGDGEKHFDRGRNTFGGERAWHDRSNGNR